ncbi:zinc transporter ZIP3-like [Periplaneta americana]|uniref:zinc transporter ZIP3-like n=1 Tax=Periplaneta americana TaxID=6978 RepID=UPI0037E79CDD
MEVLLLQIICLAVLFIAMTVCSIIPVLVVWKKNNVHISDQMTTCISFGNCIAGGVFLGMCFLGLFPYVKEKFAEVLTIAEITTSFPLSEFVIIIGFFFIFTLEHIIITTRNKIERDNLSSEDSVRMSHVEIGGDSSQADDDSFARLLEIDGQEQDMCEDNEITLSKPSHSAHNFHSLHATRGSPLGLTRHSHCDMTFAVNKSTGLRHLILLLAVSIHSLFEGVTLGLQTNEVKVFHLFLAVLFHEVLVALAFGANIAKMNMGLITSFKYILIVTGSIPVGIILGLLIRTARGLLGAAISAVLQGIAAGIFIHVTFMEIIPEELSSEKCRLLKILFFFIGFMVMAAVNIALGDH